MIFSFLKNLLANPQEALVGLIAAVLAGLVAALELQGSWLHRAQIKLLDVTLQQKQTRAADNVAAAKEAYAEALNSFIRAGGRLLLIASLLLPAYSTPARSDQVEADPATILPLCINALSMCDAVVKAQDGQIGVLKDGMAQWRAKAVSEEPGFFEQHWLGLVLGGLATGFIIGRIGK